MYDYDTDEDPRVKTAVSWSDVPPAWQETIDVDPWVDWGTCPLLSEVEATPWVVSPYFFWGGG